MKANKSENEEGIKINLKNKTTNLELFEGETTACSNFGIISVRATPNHRSK